MLDFHSHILPGLDDGAPDMETAIEMARLAVADGITMMIATPHYLEKSMENHRCLILKCVKDFQKVLNNEGIPLEIIPGCEVYLSPNTSYLLKKGELMTINDGGKYLLVEFPMQSIPNYSEEVLFNLKVQGVTPVIAHPERYLQLGRDYKLVLNLIEKGCLLQINSGSITGLYGERVKENARILIENNLIHLIGSDAHSARGRSPKIREAIDIIERVKTGKKKEILLNGMKIHNGQEVDPEIPREIQGRRIGVWEKIKKIIRLRSNSYFDS